MVGPLQANALAQRVLGEHSQDSSIDVKARLIELVKEETGSKDEQVTLYHAAMAVINK